MPGGVAGEQLTLPPMPIIEQFLFNNQEFDICVWRGHR